MNTRKDLLDKMRVLKAKMVEADSERGRLEAIKQEACDHPIEARDSVMVNNESERFCSLCWKDF